MSSSRLLLPLPAPRGLERRHQAEPAAERPVEPVRVLAVVEAPLDRLGVEAHLEPQPARRLRLVHRDTTLTCARAALKPRFLAHARRRAGWRKRMCSVARPPRPVTSVRPAKRIRARATPAFAAPARVTRKRSTTRWPTRTRRGFTVRRSRFAPPEDGRGGFPPGFEPERDVSPKATIEPVPSCCGAGSGGGPIPTATYRAPPTAAAPPNDGAPSDSRGISAPDPGSRATRKPAGSTVYSTPCATIVGPKCVWPVSCELHAVFPSRVRANTWPSSESAP